MLIKFKTMLKEDVLELLEVMDHEFGSRRINKWSAEEALLLSWKTLQNKINIQLDRAKK